MSKTIARYAPQIEGTASEETLQNETNQSQINLNGEMGGGGMTVH